MNIYIHVYIKYVVGGQGDDEKKSGSSVDLNDTGNVSEPCTSPTSDTKKHKILDSFKKKTKRFRLRSKDKHGKKDQENGSRLIQSSPDVNNVNESPLSSPNGETRPDFDSLFDAAEKRHEERSFSDPNISNGGSTVNKTEEKSNDIAVVDNTVSI